MDFHSQQLHSVPAYEQKLPSGTNSADSDPGEYAVVQYADPAKPVVDETSAARIGPVAPNQVPARVNPELAKPAEYKGKPLDLRGTSEECDTRYVFDGHSWTITQKNIRTGVIERFTQSGTGELGRLEVIQGTGLNLPADASLPDSLAPWKRIDFAWIGTEDKGPVQIASHKLVPLPRSMREDVGAMLVDRAYPMGGALENLLPDSVRLEMGRDQVAFVAGLNREAQAPAKPAAPEKPSAKHAPAAPPVPH